MTKKTAWYVGGLHFECLHCSNCCSGPGEGYIWITQPEVKFIADFLKITENKLRQEYLKRVNLRTTIIEHAVTKDCIFLKRIDGEKKCLVYPVRPNQCRTWPFWTDNLSSPGAWNKATERCNGINRGRLYSFEEIEKLKKQKQWWDDGDKQADSRKSG